MKFLRYKYQIIELHKKEAVAFYFASDDGVDADVLVLCAYQNKKTSISEYSPSNYYTSILKKDESAPKGWIKTDSILNCFGIIIPDVRYFAAHMMGDIASRLKLTESESNTFMEEKNKIMPRLLEQRFEIQALEAAFDNVPFSIQLHNHDYREMLDSLMQRTNAGEIFEDKEFQRMMTPPKFLHEYYYQ